MPCILWSPKTALLRPRDIIGELLWSWNALPALGIYILIHVLIRWPWVQTRRSNAVLDRRFHGLFSSDWGGFIQGTSRILPFLGSPKEPTTTSLIQARTLGCLVRSRTFHKVLGSIKQGHFYNVDVSLNQAKRFDILGSPHKDSGDTQRLAISPIALP